MNKVQNGPFTTVELTNVEAESVCRLGQGERCCAFLTAGKNGFECARQNELEGTILGRLAFNQMRAKGTGGWPGCPWEGVVENGDAVSTLPS